MVQSSFLSVHQPLLDGHLLSQINCCQLASVGREAGSIITPSDAGELETSGRTISINGEISAT